MRGGQDSLNTKFQFIAPTGRGISVYALAHPVALCKHWVGALQKAGYARRRASKKRKPEAPPCNPPLWADAFYIANKEK